MINSWAYGAMDTWETITIKNKEVDASDVQTVFIIAARSQMDESLTYDIISSVGRFFFELILPLDLLNCGSNCWSIMIYVDHI